MKRRIAPLALLSLAAAGIAWAAHPPGELLTSVVAVDVTAAGIDSFVPLAGEFIPEEFALAQVANGGGSILGQDWSYNVTNLNADIELINPAIVPGNGAIDASAVIGLTVNTQANPIVIEGDLEIPIFSDLSVTCEAWATRVDIPVSGQILLDYNATTGRISADVPPIGYDISQLNSDSITVDCGGFLDTIQTIADFLGFNLIDLALGQVIPILDDQIQTLVADLDQTIVPLLQNAVDTAEFNTTFEVLGVPIDIDIGPEDVQITPAGLRILLAGGISAPHDSCVDDYDVDGSVETLSTLDPLGTAPGGIPTPHVAVQADDDLINQGLFAVWDGGLLCFDIDENTEGLPLSIDTNLLGFVAPDVFDDLFPENSKMALQTKPRQPPVATLDGPHDVDIEVEDLGLAFYAELDGRQIRLMEVGLSAQAGADLAFDGTTGEIDLSIDFDTSEIDAEVTFNEFTPDSNAVIEGSLLGVVDNLAGPAISGLIQDQSFAIPSYEGLGLSTASIQPAVGAPDRLGVYANVGAVPYTGGCGEGGGCGGEAGAGCGDEGAACNSNQAPGRALLFAIPLMMAGLRRRD